MRTLYRSFYNINFGEYKSAACLLTTAHVSLLLLLLLLLLLVTEKGRHLSI